MLRFMAQTQHMQAINSGRANSTKTEKTRLVRYLFYCWVQIEGEDLN